MSSNFDFLRNFDNDLHYLACIIEDEIYDSPSAVLSDATTFLEIIIYNIIKKNELEIKDLIYFKDKIMFLSEAGYLTQELKKNMLKAYSIRNKMHSYNGDAKNHIHLNQMRAVHIHKLLFNISWLYYIENSSNRFKQSPPSYIHPSRLKDDLLIKSDISNGKCIICESETKSEDEIFCRECKYKIEKSDNLKTLRKHFGFKEGFKRNNLIEMGFEKGYIGPFIQELKNDDLINTVGKQNFIDKEKSKEYIEQAEAMMNVEKILSDFKLKNIELTEIKNHEFYLKGKNNEYPYVGFYHLFNQLLYSTFISQIKTATKIETILNNSYLTLDELNEWYFENNTSEHIIFNEKLIEEIIYYKKRNMEYDFKISDEILNAIKENELYCEKEDEIIFSSFLKNTTHEKITKKEALDAVGLTNEDLEKLLEKYPKFEKKYEKKYTQHKMEKFIKHFDYYDYSKSLKKNGLTQEEIENWLNKAKKSQNEIYLNFLNEFKKTTLKKYIEYRKKGYSENKSLKMIHTDSQTIKQLLNEYNNDLDSFLVCKTIELLKLSKTKNEIINELDLNPNWFNTSIEKGMKGDEEYVELYEEYCKNIIPNQIKTFLEMIKNKPLKNVLKQINMTEKELNNWYEQGKNSIEPYKSFYDEFLEYKKETYVKSMIKTDSKQKALKKSYFTKEELNEFEDELNKKISEKKLEIVINELEKGNTTKKASKKASIKVSTIYDWVNKALNGNEYYKDFYEVFENKYLIPIKKGYALGIKSGVCEKDIIRTLKRNEFMINEDVKYLKQLNLFPTPEDAVMQFDEEIEINLEL